MNVSVFGGAQSKPGEADYLDAMQLGRLLAKAGHTVLTGGYGGAMEAVSRGAHEAGGHVIGVPCDEIERWRPGSVNAWVREERRCRTLLERIATLVTACEAAIALSGGPGTWTEVSLLWNLMIVQAIPEKPLILVGEGWRTVMETLRATFQAYLPDDQWRLLRFVPNIQAAALLLSPDRSHVPISP